ncbi:MAG: RdgB/HAM1 family non-canonical purine NTP pyrophosphatase [candidate division WOR-3 bacterium]|nr:RdgB/HAM1 family non-canonical purine NTP pyrophosphatase [candidate division WOR-3 bacterium]
MKLLLATRNRHKLTEMQQMLEGTGWQVVLFSDLEDTPDVEEDGATFEENARKKARGAARHAGLWTLAEDAGLEVDALGGEPGVLSARYCGEGASDADRMRKVLDRIVAVPDERRTARFRCVICLVDPAGNETCFEGRCEGRISHHARGSSGFGYDPIFMPEGQALTFGELGQSVKSRISHRARAMRQVIAFLQSRVGLDGQTQQPQKPE